MKPVLDTHERRGGSGFRLRYFFTFTQRRILIFNAKFSIFAKFLESGHEKFVPCPSAEIQFKKISKYFRKSSKFA